jgi:hypothetical protein
MGRADLLRTLTCAGALGVVLGAIPGCTVEPYYPVVDGEYPAACIATTDPVTYNGFPSYWCDGLWYYRGMDGRWAHYNREPPELYRHRAEAAPGRRTYEPPRPGPRPPPPAAGHPEGTPPAGGRPGGGGGGHH